MLEFTDRAREVLRRAHDAAVRLNPDARVRLTRAGGKLVPQLTDAPEPGDVEVSLEAATVFVQGGIDGLVDVEDPHDQIVLRPG